MDGIGSVGSGTETESNARSGCRVYKYIHECFEKYFLPILAPAKFVYSTSMYINDESGLISVPSLKRDRKS